MTGTGKTNATEPKLALIHYLHDEHGIEQSRRGGGRLAMTTKLPTEVPMVSPPADCIYSKLAAPSLPNPTMCVASRTWLARRPAIGRRRAAKPDCGHVCAWRVTPARQRAFRRSSAFGSRHCWVFVVAWDTAKGGSVGTVLKSVAAQHVLSDVLFLRKGKS